MCLILPSLISFQQVVILSGTGYLLLEGEHGSHCLLNGNFGIKAVDVIFPTLVLSVDGMKLKVSTKINVINA
jgi:hypothetical protein